MEKRIIISLILLTIAFMITGCKNKEKYIYDNEKLYDVAIQYIIDNDTNPDKNKDRYKIFIDYNGFGITKDDNYRYAYLWIAEESYYVSDSKIVSSSGSSMPYKFTFELTENKVVKYEVPKDGNYYASSIKELYPDDIENKVINYQWKDIELIKDVKKQYSDLEDNNIYFYYLEDKDDINGEYIKLNK